jgi:hypothetical protein
MSRVLTAMKFDGVARISRVFGIAGTRTMSVPRICVSEPLIRTASPAGVARLVRYSA